MALWEKQETLALWFIAIIIFVGLLLSVSLFVIYKGIQSKFQQKLRDQRIKHEHEVDLREATLSNQEKERKRFAQDLHDAIIGKLTILRISIPLGISQEQMDSYLQDCIDSSRQLSHDLYPPLLNETELTDQLCSQINRYKLQFNISLTHDKRCSEDFPGTVKLHILRIVQEFCTNTVKHAQATRIDFHLRLTGNGLCIKYSDNGLGMKNNSVKGIGLKSIHDRVLQIGGILKIRTVSKGFSCLIVLKK